MVNRKKRFSPDQLIKVFWPGRAFSKGQRNLWHTLFCIRSAVTDFVNKGTPLIDRKSGCYGVRPDYKIWVDSEEFEFSIKEANQWEARGNDIADVDGDGDKDIIGADWLLLFWYENDGFQNFTGALIDFAMHGRAQSVDLDQDGDLDIIGGSSSSLFYKFLKWYENEEV